MRRHKPAILARAGIHHERMGAFKGELHAPSIELPRKPEAPRVVAQTRTVRALRSLATSMLHRRRQDRRNGLRMVLFQPIEMERPVERNHPPVKHQDTNEKQRTVGNNRSH